jgi:hypothetical protein
MDRAKFLVIWKCAVVVFVFAMAFAFALENASAGPTNCCSKNYSPGDGDGHLIWTEEYGWFCSCNPPPCPDPGNPDCSCLYRCRM